MSLAGELVARAAAREAAPVFVEYGAKEHRSVWTGAEFVRLVHRVGCSLDESGVGPGMRVAVFLHNSAFYAATIIALLSRDTVFAPLKLDYRALELSAIFRDLQPHALITESAHREHLAPYCGDRMVLIRDGNKLGRSQDSWSSYQPNPASPVSPLGPPPAGTTAVAGGTASINFTYRGHGYPLGAVVSQAQYRHGAEVLAGCIDAARCRTMLVVLPMAHIYGLVACVFLPLLYDITAVLCHSMHPRRLHRIITAEAVDFLPVVPEIAELLARFPPSDTSGIGVELLVTGGSRLTVEQYQRFRATLAHEVLNGYGLTECTPASLNLRGRARSGTDGPPVSGLEVKLAEEDGELLIRGAGVSRGYYRRPAETDAALSPEGWFHTGDVFRLADGHLCFARERKATRKVNGLMVDLAEVRTAILRHPRVYEVKVALDGNRLRAVVTTDSGSAKAAIPTAGQLREYLGERLAGYKIPQGIELTGR